MSTRKVSPRKAALLAAAVLATSTLSSPALAAVQSMSSVTAAAAASTVVSRVSLPSGPVDGGDTLLISGSGLATGTSSLTAKTVKFGTVTVDEDDVTAVSTTALEVEVPEAASAGTVQVLVGDAKKGPSYKYVGEAVTVTTDQDDLDDLGPSTDAGLPGVEITGTGFDKTTAVLVGGKPAKVASSTATKLTVAFPAGLSGVQDVVVVDSRNSEYVGYVEYAVAEPTLSAVSSYAVTEAPTVVYLTGTQLDAVTAVTFDGTEKVAFTKTTDPTTLAVTVPKGTAKTANIKVSTKSGKNASVSLVRKASVAPAVTAVTGALAGGGDATLTGTNLVGLKTVTVTPAGGKAVKAKVAKVSSATSATVTLPKLPAGNAGIVVNNNAATASSSYTFVVSSGAATVSAASVNGAKTVVTLTGTFLKTVNKVVLTPTSGSAIERTTGLVANSDGTSLTVTLTSALASGTYGVVATNPAGASSSASLTVAAAPTISSVVADSAKTGITVTGTALTGATKVTFTPTSGSAVERASGLTVNPAGTSLTTTLPAPLAAGTYTVTVTTPAGTSTGSSLTITATPIVDGISANADADEISITGTALSGATKVTFSPTSGDDIEVTTGLTPASDGTGLEVVLAEALASDTYSVVVTTPGGDSSAIELEIP